MGKNRSMTLEQRSRLEACLKPEWPVARNIGVSHCTISRLQTKFNATGSLKDRPFTGRPRKSTANEDRYITLISHRNRFISENNRSVLYTTRTIVK